MQHSPNDIKEKLLRALDKDNNVVDMVSVIEAIAVLERIPITKDELEKTRLGKYINELRKKTKNDVLAKRAKDLVRKWRKMILPPDSGGAVASATVNGERQLFHGVGSAVSPSIVTSHLPGPGPGPSCGRQSTSPATANHIRAASRAGLSAAAAHALSSPGYSQCSSTSTSPSLFVATAAGRLSRSEAAGSLTSPYAARLASGGRLNSFKPVSPAPTTNANAMMGGRTPTTPAGVSSGKYGRSITSPAVRGSPVAAITRGTPVTITTTSRKRPHEAIADNCDSARLSAANSSSSSPRVVAAPSGHKGLVNGAALQLPHDANSMDSMRSGDSDVTAGGGRGRPSSAVGGELESAAADDPTAKPKRKNARRARVEKCDMLKDKLASHLRTPKVKTTAELIQELKARNSGSGGGSAAAVRTSGAEQAESAADYSARRKAAYSALLGTDEDVTRNKTELMEKFLKDSVGKDGSSSSAAAGSSRNYHRLSSHGAGTSRVGDESLNGAPGPSLSSNQSIDDCVAAILAQLPPIRPDEIRWDSSSGSGSDDGEAEEEEEVTDEQLSRLHDGTWEGVNGNTDRQGEFRRWNQSVTLTSFDSDVLHILPYVDIDK